MLKKKKKRGIIKGNRTLYTVITTHQAWLSLTFFFKYNRHTKKGKREKRKQGHLCLTLHVANYRVAVGGMHYALYIFIQIYVYSARATNSQREGKRYGQRTHNASQERMHTSKRIIRQIIHTYTHIHMATHGDSWGEKNPLVANYGSSINQSRVCSRDTKPTTLPAPKNHRKEEKQKRRNLCKEWAMHNHLHK